jgi:hypothetical protein
MSDSQLKELQKQLQKNLQELEKDFQQGLQDVQKQSHKHLQDVQKQSERDWKEVKDKIEDLKREQAISLGKIVSRHDDLGKNFEAVKSELASVKNQFSEILDEKIFDHKPFSDELKELIKRAYFNIHSPHRDNRIEELGLTKSQDPLKPSQYDILARTYLLAPTRLGANSNTLDGHVEGLNHEGIKRHAILLRDLGYLMIQKARARKHVSGVHPDNYHLTQKGKEVLLDETRSLPTENRDIHADLERKRLIQAVTHPPYPEVYMCTREDIGNNLQEIDRCDAIVRCRKGGESYSEGVRAVIIETDKDFERHSYRPKKEGKVFINMVTPFIFGAKSLEIIYEPTSTPELQKMWNALPSWLQAQIHFNPIP